MTEETKTHTPPGTSPQTGSLTSEEDPKLEVATLSRKLPPFWKIDPVLWFTQVEAVFATARISQPLTMFQYIISALDIDVLSQVSDIVKNPGRSPYDEIKSRLIQVYSDSEHKRITKLLEASQLGNQKPSAFLRQMTQLANGAVSNDMLRTLWLRNLPTRVQAILAATAQDDVHKLAEVADKILEVDRSTEIYSNSSNQELLNQLTSNVASLKLQVDNLTRQLSQQNIWHNRGRSPFRRNYPTRSPHNKRPATSAETSPARQNSRQRAHQRGYCFFHHKFGKKARKCEQPCSWTTTEAPLNSNQ